MNERWPPIYDYAELLATIKDLIKNDRLTSQFFESKLDTEKSFFQGDILHLRAPFAYLNQDAQAEAIDENSGYWLLLSNSCDLDRKLDEVPWAQIVPIELFDDLPKEEIEKYKSYQLSRAFYIPEWSGDVAGQHGIADFCRPVTISREGISAHATVVARLTRYSWILLHSCLVRYLARDDGRRDPS